jgi:hypothetical protein
MKPVLLILSLFALGAAGPFDCVGISVSVKPRDKVCVQWKKFVNAQGLPDEKCIKYE